MLCLRGCRLSHKKRFETRPRGARPADRRENSVHDASTSHSIGGEEIETGRITKEDAGPRQTRQTKQKMRRKLERCVSRREVLIQKNGKKASGRLAAPTKHDGARRPHVRMARSDKPEPNAGPTEQFHVSGQWRVEMGRCQVEWEMIVQSTEFWFCCTPEFTLCAATTTPVCRGRRRGFLVRRR